MTNQQLRQQVLERDNYTCQNCLIKVEELHIHHLTPRNKGGSDILENLRTLCPSCHKRIEASSKTSEIHRLFKNSKDKASLRTTIPMFAIQRLGLQAGDELAWIFDVSKEDNQLVLVGRKVKHNGKGTKK